MDNFNLTKEEVKEMVIKYNIKYDDTENQLKRKAESYLRYKSNCKFVMDNFNLTQEDVKKIYITGIDPEEKLK